MAAAAQTVEPLNVYIGWDSREAIASDVCASSIIRHTKHPIKFHYLKHRQLRKDGYFKRPWLIEGDSGEFRDLLDDKPFSTEFSHTRFLVPELQGFKGWALFLDSDMIFQDDIKKLFEMTNQIYAVMCVKHNHEVQTETSKMDGRVQQKYFRKNWSSFVLWNCGHKGNAKLTRDKVTFMPGRDLHSFSWLPDHEIGSLPFNYNFISGISPNLPRFTSPNAIPEKQTKQLAPSCIHFTEGGPWFEGCKSVPYADLWDKERRIWEDNGAPIYDKYIHGIEA